MDNKYKILSPTTEESLTNDEMLLLYRIDTAAMVEATGLHTNTLLRARKGAEDISYGSKVKIRTYLMDIAKDLNKEEVA